MPFSCNRPELLVQIILINSKHQSTYYLPAGLQDGFVQFNSVSHREVSKERSHWNLPFRYWPQVMVTRHSVLTVGSAMTAGQPSTLEFLKTRRPKWACSSSLSFNLLPLNQPGEVREGRRKEPSAGQRSLWAGTLCSPSSLRALAHNRSPLDQRCQCF